MNGEGSQLHRVSFPQQLFQFRSSAFQWQSPQTSFSKTKGFLESSHSLFPKVWEVAGGARRAFAVPGLLERHPMKRLQEQSQLLPFLSGA